MLDVEVRNPPLGVISLGMELLKATTFCVYFSGDRKVTSLCDSSTNSLPIRDFSFRSLIIIFITAGMLSIFALPFM